MLQKINYYVNTRYDVKKQKVYMAISAKMFRFVDDCCANMDMGTLTLLSFLTAIANIQDNMSCNTLTTKQCYAGGED